MTGAGSGRRPFSGWWVLGGCIGLQALAAAVMQQSYGAYVVVLRQEFGWSVTVLSLASSLARIENGALGPIQGWMIDRFGPQRVILIGLMLFAAGMAGLALVDSEATFVAAYLVISIGSGLAGFMTLTVATVNWFERRRGTALGLMGTGFGIGSLFVPGVVWMMTTFGWRTATVISAVLVIVIGLPLGLLVRDSPERYGQLPDGRPRAAPAPDSDAGPRPVPGVPQFTIGQALRTRSFWLLAFGHASALLVVSAVMVHLIPDLTETQGFSLEGAALVATALTVVQMAGQVGGGFIGDRVNQRLIVVSCMLAHAAGLVLLAFANSGWMVAGFVILHGLAWGIRGPMMQTIRADYFGRASFGKVMGFSTMIVTLGSIFGPLVAGVAYDATGSYTSGFLALALMAALGSLFFVFATRPALPVPAVAAPSGRG